MTDFAQVFQNNHNNISDAVEWDRSAASQVIPSHSAKSHDSFDALGGTLLFALTLFQVKKQLMQA